MTLILIGSAACVRAQSATPAAIIDITDRNQFDAAYPTAKHLNFDSAAGRSAPFQVDGVQILGGGLAPQVLDTLVGLPANFWFGAQTTSPDFLLTNLAVQIKFSADVAAIGFDLQCFACDDPGQPTPVNAIVLDADGNMLGYLQPYPAALTGEPTSSPAFLGVASDQPFRSGVFQRSGNWMLANLRYAPDRTSSSGSSPGLASRERLKLSEGSR